MDILTDHAGGDANGAREVLTSDIYRRFFAKMTLDGPANVLDLGANNGGFPLLLAAEGIALKKVVSVELNPRTFVRLHFNLTRNLDCEIVPINAALCGEARTMRIRLGRGGVSDDIYGNSGNPSDKEFEIRGFSLDDLVGEYFDGEYVDICKIDVEGAEFEVFLRPEHQRLRQCRYLIMEIHERGEREAGEILPAIEKLGFVRRETEPGADPTVHFFVNTSVNAHVP
jgi:FkbM family methyltransferase